MDLHELASLALRRGWLVALCTLIGAAAGLGLSLSLRPTFEAVTPVEVRAARPADLGQTQAIKQILVSFSQDIGTTEVVSDALKLLDKTMGAAWVSDHGLGVGAIQEMLGTDTNEDVYEIQIKAKSKDAEGAEQVSARVAEAFSNRREQANLQLDKDDRIHIVVRDRTIVNQAFPKKRLVVPAGAVLGLLLGVLAVLVFEIAATARVRHAADAEAHAGAPVLGEVVVRTVPRGRSAGSARTSFVSDWRRGWSAAWPVVALALLGAVTAFVASQLQPTVYRARTRVAIEPARGSDWGQTQAILAGIRGDSANIKTAAMAIEVNERLQLDQTPDALLDKLQVAAKGDVYEILVDVLDQNPETAEAISRTWSQVFIEARQRSNLELDQRDRTLARLRGDTGIEVWRPKTGVNVLAGAALGLLLGLVGLYATRQLAVGRVAGGDDAAQAAGAALLGAVPGSK